MSLISILGKEFILKSILHVLYFPLWWYREGLLIFFKKILNQLRQVSGFLALKIMFSNLFKPMYGEYSFSGRLISFLIRILVLLFRSMIFFVFCCLGLALICCFAAIIPLSIWQIAILS